MSFTLFVIAVGHEILKELFIFKSEFIFRIR